MTSMPRPVSSITVAQIHRPGVIVRESTAASRSASIGLARPARRAAAHTPASDTRSPVPNAMKEGQVASPMENQGGATDPRTIQAANRGAP